VRKAAVAGPDLNKLCEAGVEDCTRADLAQTVCSEVKPLAYLPWVEYYCSVRGAYDVYCRLFSFALPYEPSENADDALLPEAPKISKFTMQCCEQVISRYYHLGSVAGPFSMLAPSGVIVQDDADVTPCCVVHAVAQRRFVLAALMITRLSKGPGVDDESEELTQAQRVNGGRFHANGRALIFRMVARFLTPAVFFDMWDAEILQLKLRDLFTDSTTALQLRRRQAKLHTPPDSSHTQVQQPTPGSGSRSDSFHEIPTPRRRALESAQYLDSSLNVHGLVAPSASRRGSTIVAVPGSLS